MLEEKKANDIIKCLSNPEVDLWRLREYALTEGGLLNHSLRRRAWPKLLGIDRTDKSSVLPNINEFKPDQSGVPSPSEIEQVQRDVVRSSWHLLSWEQRKEWEGDKSNAIGSYLIMKQNALANLIKTVLQQSAQQSVPQSNHLRYYQGYHDIAAIFLSVFSNGTKAKKTGKRYTMKINLGLVSAMLLKISRSHLCDSMQPDFTAITAAIQVTVFPMIQYLDARLHSHLLESGVEPYFALSWILTWFSHDVHDTKTVARLFDAFIAAHALFPLYLTVAMVLHPVNRYELLDKECDFATMHMALQALPKKSCPISQIQNASNGSADRNIDPLEDANEFGNSLKENQISYIPPPVPFEELIDKAIIYMRRLPPRKLIPLASQYRKGILSQHLRKTPNIVLFKHPQAWALAATVPSDSVLKINRSRKGVTNKESNKQSTGGGMFSNAKSPDLKKVQPLIDSSVAIVALGIGPDSSRRKRRKILGSIGIVVVAVTNGWQPSVFPTVWFNKQFQPPSQSPLAPPSPPKINPITKIFQTAKQLLASDAEIIFL